MLFLVGRSATGKTEIVKFLINNYNMKKMVTYTTRPIRINEIDGIDYHFISKDDFNNRIKESFFFEYVEYNGNYYGTAKDDISDEKVVILEPSGISFYKEKLKEKATIVFLTCRDDILIERMVKRGDSKESIEKRMTIDNDVFKEELKQVSDVVLDTSKDSIEIISKKIIEFYREKNYERNN